MREAVSISWVPPQAHSVGLSRFKWASAERDVRWECLRPGPDDWSSVEKALREAGDELRTMPIAEIVAAIDRVAERWGDRGWPRRIRARDAIVEATGFSAEAVERSFDVELRNYRADSLWRALRRELGDPRVLDGFRADPELSGRARAVGPGITLVVLTGNVPGLPALPIVRSLLVKSSVVAKVASGEPTFAASFAESLFEEDPRLGRAVLVTYWSRDDSAMLQGAIDISDAAIVFGSREACASFRAALPADRRVVEHGHKFSVGIVTRAYRGRTGDAELADRIARDLTIFNQHACIAPQAYLVEGSPDEARALQQALATALDRWAVECPLGTLTPTEAASLQLRRAAHAWSAASDPQCDLAQSRGLDWTVAVSPSLPPDAGGGNRFLHLVPVESTAAALSLLEPYGRYLQNVGLGATSSELAEIAERLARLGASRLSEPGRMADPSMMWRHDGEPCIAALVRWCDLEMHSELLAATRDGGVDDP